MKKLNILNKLKSQTILGLAGASLMFGACGQETDPSDLKIYGGTKVAAGEWNSTVGITNNGSMFCSGTIVHPRLVITAAHCVANTSSARSLGVYMGEGREGGRVSDYYQVESFAYSPNYRRGSVGWDDIAYLVTAEEMDIDAADIPEILMNEDEMDEILKVGNEVHLVGFGTRNDRGFGVKYEVDAPITRINSNEVYIGRDGKDSCQGDSGGPAYGQLANGEWRVFGVVSRGGACGTGGIWGRMSANICWVEKDSGVDIDLPLGACGEEVPDDGDGENPGDGDGENPGDGDGENPGDGDGEEDGDDDIGWPWPWPF